MGDEVEKKMLGALLPKKNPKVNSGSHLEVCDGAYILAINTRYSAALKHIECGTQSTFWRANFVLLLMFVWFSTHRLDLVACRPPCDSLHIFPYGKNSFGTHSFWYLSHLPEPINDEDQGTTIMISISIIQQPGLRLVFPYKGETNKHRLLIMPLFALLHLDINIIFKNPRWLQ